MTIIDPAHDPATCCYYRRYLMNQYHRHFNFIILLYGSLLLGFHLFLLLVFTPLVRLTQNWFIHSLVLGILKSFIHLLVILIDIFHLMQCVHFLCLFCCLLCLSVGSSYQLSEQVIVKLVVGGVAGLAFSWL